LNEVAAAASLDTVLAASHLQWRAKLGEACARHNTMMIFLLRHADRSTSADALSQTGRKRAERLGHMLGETGVSVAFWSGAQRTRETLEPLQQVRGDALAIKKPEASGGLAHINEIVAAIESLPADTVVVVVGHSDTVGPIIKGLGGGSIAPIQETEFDKLFLLCRAAGGEKTLLGMRY
jgi:phosphohistidine phosphatase SixA